MVFVSLQLLFKKTLFKKKSAKMDQTKDIQKIVFLLSVLKRQLHFTLH